jgi:hypothetical protein
LFLPKAAAAALLCLLISGGNYITALTTVLLMTTMVIACFVFRKPPAIKTTFVILFLLLLAGFFINILAPGHAIRQEHHTQAGAIEAVLMSLRFAGGYVSLLDLRIVSALLFLSPIFYKMAKETHYLFKHPLLVPFFSFCFYAAGYAPTAYAMSFQGDERVRNVIYFTFVLLVFINYFYLIGHMVRVIEEQQIPLSQGFLLHCTCAASIFAVVFFLACAIRFDDYTSIIATKDLYNGTAKQYAMEIDEGYKILHDDSIKQVELPPISVEPILLSFGIISTDKNNWVNQGVARSYQKEYVVVKEELGK